ncbi:GNAT family N-acetyltransferase [Roseibium salinum]|nr:GNAT family N-acetyltransferase [Roseibium salinum]
MMTLPELKTRRLILRPLEANDAAAIADLGGRDFQIVRWLTGASWPYVEGEAEDYVDHLIAADPMKTEAVYAVTLGGVFIGVVAVEAPGDLKDLPDLPTIGYWIGRAFQGHGYASEAVDAVLEWAFEAYGTGAIAARAFEEKHPLARAASQEGLQALRHDGTLRQGARPQGDQRGGPARSVRFRGTQGGGVMLPEIPTGRLVLRPVVPDDLPVVTRLIGEYDVAKKMLSLVPHPYSLSDAKAWYGLNAAKVEKRRAGFLPSTMATG